MNNRQRLLAVLNYENYDRMPIVHFGFWTLLLEKWVNERHLKPHEIINVDDGSPNERFIAEKLGFDFNYYTTYQDLSGFSSLFPAFEPKHIRDHADGSYEYFNEDGVIILQKEATVSIPFEIDHLLKDRASWEEHYLPRLQYSEERFDKAAIQKLAFESKTRSEPLGIYCKSLFGQIRNWLGLQEISYLYADDEDLYIEILNTVGELVYKTTKRILESGIIFDFAHFWEDICFKNGPMVVPSIFAEKVGPHYHNITNLVKQHKIEIISLDCDGVIDSLLPIWFENGINTMFPIEVGTWKASIIPWREKFGKKLRGVGGVNKHVLSKDEAAIDQEIERLKPLVALGGYIPCPDHRLPVDTKWELVQYYCDRMLHVFSNKIT
jgi:uroporphyrinogen decarboxylase